MDQNILSVETVRNLREGDFVWITVSDDTEPEEVDGVHEAVSAILPDNINLIVTRAGYLQGIRVAPLDELLEVQALVEHLLAAYTAARAIDV